MFLYVSAKAMVRLGLWSSSTDGTSSSASRRASSARRGVPAGGEVLSLDRRLVPVADFLEDAQRLVRQLLGAIEVPSISSTPARFPSAPGSLPGCPADGADRAPLRGFGGQHRRRRSCIWVVPSTPSAYAKRSPTARRSCHRHRTVGEVAGTFRFLPEQSAGSPTRRGRRRVLRRSSRLLARWRVRTSGALRPGSHRCTTTIPTRTPDAAAARRQCSRPANRDLARRDQPSASRKLSSSISARSRAIRCWRQAQRVQPLGHLQEVPGMSRPDVACLTRRVEAGRVRRRGSSAAG